MNLKNRSIEDICDLLKKILHSELDSRYEGEFNSALKYIIRAFIEKRIEFEERRIPKNLEQFKIPDKVKDSFQHRNSRFETALQILKKKGYDIDYLCDSSKKPQLRYVILDTWYSGGKSDLTVVEGFPKREKILIAIEIGEVRADKVLQLESIGELWIFPSFFQKYYIFKRGENWRYGFYDEYRDEERKEYMKKHKIKTLF